jgi:hydrogenase maturation protein HypF
MNDFEMCSDCREEYENPSDRRFHAQPNACFLCGPQLYFTDNTGIVTLDARPKLSNNPQENIESRRRITQKIIGKAISALKEGKVLAIKGLGGFHLAVNAENEHAVQKLRERKNRYEKPLAVMSYDFNKIQKYANLNSYDKLLLESVQKPITLVKKRPKNSIAPSVAPNSDTFGVMLPYTPLHEMLLQKDFLALVMTSGNISDEPICTDNNEALEKLGNIADCFLMHNRDIYFRCDDAVVRNISVELNPEPETKKDLKIISETSIKRIYFRRSRGYVPTPILISHDLPQVLALGAELKNTVALTKNRRVFLSQHIGDLENIETLDYFQKTIDHLKNILQIEPEAIAYDLHPEYLNTKWMQENDSFNDIDLYGVQHHHAHIVSCMAENNVDQKVIGFAMDGTGYGTDNAIWGGEVMICDASHYERYTHFSYMPLPGGDLAVREPWRIAVAYLHQTYKDQIFDLKIPFLKAINEDKKRTIIRMIERNINTYKTSSLGRLFDAVAALVINKNTISYEGQAAIELEALVYKTDDTNTTCYNIEVDDNNIINTEDIIRKITGDIIKKTNPEIISRKFHLSIAKILAKTAVKIRDERGINKIAMSGGCFQNNFFMKNLIQMLSFHNFEIYTHRLVPPNDGGISLGQAVIAGFRHMKKQAGN